MNAYCGAWVRLGLAPTLAPHPRVLMGGSSPLRSLFFDVLEYRSKINVYLRARSRRLQKFDRGAPKYTASLAYAPPRARLGQVARALRLLSASRLAFEATGLTRRLVTRDLVFLWLCGGLG